MIYMIAEKIRAALKSERGLETLEYAVFAAAFLVIVAGAVTLMSADISAAYTDIGNFISSQGGKM